jgi:integrase
MSKLVIAESRYRTLTELPEVARTRSGVELDPRSDRWVYRDDLYSVSLDFGKLHATASFVASAKHVLLWYVERLSSSHASNLFDRLGHYLKTISTWRNAPINEITTNDLINYKASLSNATVWYLGALSGLFQQWHRLGYPGVTDDAVAFLRQIRIKGNPKGLAVLTHDPIYGPFTDIEFQSIEAALDGAYCRGEIDLEGYLLAYLFMLLGQRPIQYAALKVRDVERVVTKDGTTIYTIQIPRAKQRDRLSREDFKTRLIIPQIGELLIQHAADIREKFHGLLPDPSEAPLFPMRGKSKGAPAGFEYHRTAQTLADLLERTLKKLSIISERTGKPLHITATRFRRTLATRAAMEGHGELVIAELLDHTDTQNVGIYIEARPEIVERIDRAIAFHMAPIAQAFAGTLIRDESEATRCDDPTSRICDPRFDPTMSPLANCGKNGFCGLAAPIACYTCVHFEPWLDGPHEAVLEFLLAERERLASRGDMRIASINDRTIFAVAQVVQLCKAQRGEYGRNG